MPDNYHTIEKPSFTEFKERGSSFLAYAFPIHPDRRASQFWDNLIAGN